MGPIEFISTHTPPKTLSLSLSPVLAAALSLHQQIELDLSELCSRMGAGFESCIESCRYRWTEERIRSGFIINLKIADQLGESESSVRGHISLLAS